MWISHWQICFSHIFKTLLRQMIIFSSAVAYPCGFCHQILSSSLGSLHHCEAHLVNLSFARFQAMRPRIGEKKVYCRSSYWFTCVAYRLKINILNKACQAGSLLCAPKFYENAAAKKSKRPEGLWTENNGSVIGARWELCVTYRGQERLRRRQGLKMRVKKLRNEFKTCHE